MYGYENEMEMLMEDPDFLPVFLVIYGIFLLIALAIGVTMYVLKAAGLYSIAKRRNIRNPWMAWVPVVSSYMMGCVADQYQHVVKERTTRRRTVLLVLSILSAVLVLAVIGLYIAMVVQMVTMTGGEMISEDELLMQVMGPVSGVLLVFLVMLVVEIVRMVFHYIALYDLFASCDPGSKVVLLVFSILSLFVFDIEPILVFVYRKRDDGMIRPQKSVDVPPQIPDMPME